MSESQRTSTDRFGLFLTAGLVVAAWKVAALLLLSFGPTTSEGVGIVKVLLAGVGLTFVTCGLVVLRKRPGRVSVLFAGFCLCAGLHWGGPLELAAGTLRTGLLFFYLLVSSLLGEALFLHFALSFPKVSGTVSGRVARFLIYGPLVAGSLLAALAVGAPLESGARAVGQSGFLLLHTVVSNLFPAIVLVLYVSYVARRSVAQAERPFVGLMVIGMLAAWLPYLAGSAVGLEDTDLFNLAMVALPVTFAVAILRIRRTRVSVG